MLVLRLLSGCSSGWTEPRVPGVGSPFSQARLAAGLGSRPSAAGLERMEFLGFGSRKQSLGTGQASRKAGCRVPIWPDYRSSVGSAVLLREGWLRSPVSLYCPLPGYDVLLLEKEESNCCLPKPEV